VLVHLSVTCSRWPAGWELLAWCAGGDHRGDDGQREASADMRHRHWADLVHAGLHQRLGGALHPDEPEDGGQASGEMRHAAERPANQEVEVAEGKQGERVRGED
jgi:hypothetical protein